MYRGIATFTLDEGRCPKWLFERMVKLSRFLIPLIIEEYGPDEFLKRLAHPVWFQSLGTVLAFDWNASGLTTILTAVLKQAIKGQEKDLGIFICGGKGKTSLKTPQQIIQWSDRLSLNYGQDLVYNSKMTAKVDNSLIQDGYQIYHHSFIFSKNGSWTVIQQGMNINSQSARRYHWYSDSIKFHSPLGSNSLVLEPHFGIASQEKKQQVLNLTAKESEKTQQISLDLVKNGFSQLMKDLKLLDKYYTPLSKMISFKNKKQDQLTLLNLSFDEFDTHPVIKENFSQNKYLQKILYKLTDQKPENFEKLLSIQGVGPKTIRALALTAEVLYGAKPSFRDPARYSFAHGGKDATPYPVDRETYDKTIEEFKKLIRKAKLPQSEKRKIQNKLENK